MGEENKEDEGRAGMIGQEWMVWEGREGRKEGSMKRKNPASV